MPDWENFSHGSNVTMNKYWRDYKDCVPLIAWYDLISKFLTNYNNKKNQFVQLHWKVKLKDIIGKKIVFAYLAHSQWWGASQIVELCVNFRLDVIWASTLFWQQWMNLLHSADVSAAIPTLASSYLIVWYIEVDLRLLSFD